MVWPNGHLGVEGRDPTMTLSDVVFLPRGSVTMSAPSYKVSMANQSRIPPEFTWGAKEVTRLPEQGQVPYNSTGGLVVATLNVFLPHG